MEFRHVPVMLNECIDSLKILPNGVYIVNIKSEGVSVSHRVVKIE